MILKGKERGNGAQFGPYLMDIQKNEHVEVLEVRAFVSDNVVDALLELDMIAKGTHCKNSMFSVVLSPPKAAEINVYEDAISRIEERLGLTNQPRVVVFHEKDSRRHAHCVWSRIDAKTMRAINLPFYKTKLKEISKQLYLDYGWKLPQGFINREQRNPLNFTHEEFQLARRLGDDPKTIKATLQECWSISKTKAKFETALEQHGYYLARGNRRAYVAVDWRGEVYSLSRQTLQKKKTLEEKLGSSAELQSVDDIRANIDTKLTKKLKALIKDIHNKYQTRIVPLTSQSIKLKNRHNLERERLSEKQEQRWQQELKQRQARLANGFRGLWDRLTGQHARIIKQNELETYECYIRDREQKDRLVEAQLKERQSLQQAIEHTQSQQDTHIHDLKEKLFSSLQQDRSQSLETVFEHLTQNQEQTTPSLQQSFELSM